MTLLLNIIYFLSIPVVCLSFGESLILFLSRVKSVIEYNSVSLLYEHCDERWITADFSALEKELEEKLFGQPLVVDVVSSALYSHFHNNHRRKPLVMSFHGWTGSGKSYVATFILKHMFRNGLRSKYIRRYNAKTHFPLQSRIDLYQEQLHKELKETIAKCENAVFVFDEVDKYPKGVLDAVKPYLDYDELVNGYDYRNAVFIFLTNNGQSFITAKALEFRMKGVHRDHFQLEDFENILKEQSFNDEGGFYRSELIKHHLVDHYVPFLPLEKEHVAECIAYEIHRLGGDINELQNQANELLESLSFGPKEHEVYAVSGCKVVSEKVSVMIEKINRLKRRNKHKWEL